MHANYIHRGTVLRCGPVQVLRIALGIQSRKFELSSEILILCIVLAAHCLRSPHAPRMNHISSEEGFELLSNFRNIGFITVRSSSVCRHLHMHLINNRRGTEAWKIHTCSQSHGNILVAGYQPTEVPIPRVLRLTKQTESLPIIAHLVDRNGEGSQQQHHWSVVYQSIHKRVDGNCIAAESPQLPVDTDRPTDNSNNAVFWWGW